MKPYRLDLIARLPRVLVAALTLLCLTLLPTDTLAQGSGIAGVVRDTTGAVLPGVTVEASSPALIEKVRTAVTDEQGQYRITDLRPGIYTVTFSLTGFSVVKREAIELTTNFTATVNAELRVGALEETVTVSGQSPVVDIQNVVQQKVLTRDLLDTLPTSRGLAAFSNLIPGATSSSVPDVGGSSGDLFVTMALHGGRPGDQRIGYDGFRSNNVHAGGGGAGYTMYVNPGSVEEVSVALDNLSAESEVGGVKIDVIPREGGNTFTGSFFATGTNGGLQSDNLSADLMAQGLTAVGQVRNIWDVNPAFGGRIVRDRLWFYTAHRWWGNETEIPNAYFNATPLDWTCHTRDLDRPAFDDKGQRSNLVRFTWQASPKNKVSVYYDNQWQVLNYYGASASVSPEAATQWFHEPNYTVQGKWSAPVTSRLLFEGGVGFVLYNRSMYRVPPVTPDTISVTELSTNLTYRAAPVYQAPSVRDTLLSEMYNERFIVSYVTGTHAFKTGVVLAHGRQVRPSVVNGDMTYQFLNGAPRTVILRATPLREEHRFFPDLGIFLQDQWTVKQRLTLNLGLRYTHHNAWVAATQLPAGTFVPARQYPEVRDVPNWTDLTPRLGAAYDLFGDGKTAIKVSFGEYLITETTATADANNPQDTVINTASRGWTDLNRDYVPNCDLLDPVTNGECGPLSATNFGQPSVVSTRYDTDVLRGYGKRPNNWEASVGMQHEILPGASVNVSYFQRWYKNYQVVDNLAAAPSDYDPYCVTAPVDSRLPDGGGYEICGLYDINPTKFGRVDSLVTFADNYGSVNNVYQGLDVTLNARLQNGSFVSGGLNVGRELVDNCDVVGKVDAPAGPINPGSAILLNPSGVGSPSALFCRVAPSFFQPQLKFQGAYPLPWWGLQTSATFQSIPGPLITASWVVPNALIAPSLGRNLSAGVNGTATVPLIEPGTMYGERLNQVDVRIAKTVRIGRTRIQGLFDLYNVFNASPVTALNTRYGPSWQQPLLILQGRLLKFGVQANF